MGTLSLHWAALRPPAKSLTFTMPFLLQPGPFHYLAGSLVASRASKPNAVKQGAADKKPLRPHV